MRARRGVTISPSTKRYIYLVNTKNHRFTFKTEVKTKNGEWCSNLLLCNNKNDARKVKVFIRLYEYILHFESDLRVTRAKDAARIFFCTHLYARSTISDALQQPDRGCIERNRRRR